MSTTEGAAAALPIRARGPAGGAPVLVNGLTEASTFSELECAVRIALNIDESNPLIFLAGFPPKPLELEEDQPLKGLLRANEVIMVREDDGGEATVIQGKGMMKKSRGGNKKKAAAASASSPSALGGGGANVHTLNGAMSSSSSAARGGRGGGGSSSSGGPRKKRRIGAHVSNEEDIGSFLVNAIGRTSSGNPRDGRFMRVVFRKAIEKQYDESKALARVEAANSGNYVIEEANDSRRVDGTASRINVTFAKGHGFRSNHIDNVELLSQPQLLGVVGAVVADEQGREMLKPESMAGCSPRVFWSLLHHYGRNGIESALSQLLPTQDWSFLHERVRKLSEKALENLEQEQEIKRQNEEAARLKQEQREARLAQRAAREAAGSGGGGGKKKGGSKKTREEDEDVQVVEDGGAGGSSGGGVDVEERERRGQAAMARFGGGAAAAGGGGGQQQQHATEGSAGHAEEDEDEEIDSDFPEIVTDQWVRIFSKPPFNITGARALAAKGADDLTPLIHQMTTLPKSIKKKPTEDEVHEWITACREQELDDIMMEIVGDNDVLDALERVRVSTPLDVKIWGAMPNTLLDMMHRDLSEEMLEKVEEKLLMENIEKWAKEADRLIGEMPWLEFWASE